MRKEVNPMGANSNYDYGKDPFYQRVENGKGIISDEIAYRVLGNWSFSNISAMFLDRPTLYLCDVGCYLGGSTARWARYSMGISKRTMILGTDIHPNNIEQARKDYGHIEVDT
jgi:hypothetical protein